MITALVPLKANSNRVPHKNFRKFADSNLATIKINQLLGISGLQVMVNSDYPNILDVLYEQYGNQIQYVQRPDYFGTSKCTASDFFVNLAESAKTEHVVYTPVTSPLVSDRSIKLGKERYLSLGEHDSVASVQLMKDHMWLNGKPLNYEHGKVPNSQDLPDIMKITYGFCFISREKMIENANVIGDKPEFVELNEQEAWDIDTMLDFALAEYMYNQKRQI